MVKRCLFATGAARWSQAETNTQRQPAASLEYDGGWQPQEGSVTEMAEGHVGGALELLLGRAIGGLDG